MSYLPDCYKRQLCFFHYCVENNIISNVQMKEWADNEIEKKEDIPFFVYDMSLSKFDYEQFRIIEDVMFDNGFSKNDFLDTIDIINQLKYLYVNGSINTVEAINDLFYLESNIKNTEEKEYIYLLDYYSELYQGNKMKLDDLKNQLNSFFIKYGSE